MLDSALDYGKLEHLFYHLVIAAKELDTIPKSEPVVHGFYGTFVASRTRDKFHYPGCAWAKMIKDENKVWFDSEAEATKLGFVAHDCLIVVDHHHEPIRISEHNESYEKMQKQIQKMEKILARVKSQGAYDKKQLEHLEVKLELNKIKLKRMAINP